MHLQFTEEAIKGRPGRPKGSRNADPMYAVPVRIPQAHADALARIALREGVSMSRLIRQILTRAVRPRVDISYTDK